MTQQVVNIGVVANDGTGDTLRAAFDKLNDNFGELYAWTVGGGMAETPTTILDKLLTVDGAGSGLNADLLDGLSSAAFAAAVHGHAIVDVTGLQAALDAKAAASHTHAQADVTGLTAALALKLNTSSYTAADVLAKLLTVDGSGSGIDADLLDGQSAAAFAAASHTHAQSEVTGLVAALAAKLDSTSYTAADVLAKLLTVDGAGTGLDADLLDGQSSAAFAAASHTHAQSEVTGLVAALAAKLDSASYTAADVLAKLLTVDGAGTGLDADLLDGQSSAAFLLAASYTAADILSKLLTVDGAGSGLDADLLDGLSSADFAAAAHTHAQSEVTGLVAALAAKLDAASYTAADVLTKLLTVDGSGSGLDADLLDGQSAAAFAAASHAHAIADVTGLQAALDAKGDLSSAAAVSVDSEVVVYSGTTGKLVKRAIGSGLATLTAGVLSVTSAATFAAAVHTHAQSDVTGLTAALAAKLDSSAYTAADVLAKLLTVDGSGSGIDADLLDGNSSAAFAAASHTHAQADVTGLTAALAAKLDSSAYTAADVLTKLLTVDGSGTGLDADLLDGISSAGFLQTSTYQALTPTWTQTHTFSDKINLIGAAIPGGLSGGGAGTLIVGSTTTGAISLFQYGAVSHLNLHRTNGSAGAETALVSTDQMGKLRFSGNYNTSGVFYSGCEWVGVATENWSATNRGTRMDAYVTKLATSTLTRVLQMSEETFTALENTETPQLSIGSTTGTSLAAINGLSIIGTGQMLFRLLARAGAAAFQSIRVNGTSASPTAIVTNDQLGSWTARGATDTTPTIGTGGILSFVATENWSGSARGALIRLTSILTGGTTAFNTLELLGTQAKFLDGTVTLPSVSLQNDPDCGMYRIGANNIGISCNATNVLDISTSLLAITATTVRFNTTSVTTVGAAGGASALPATPLGYITTNVNGTACKIPFYNT